MQEVRELLSRRLELDHLEYHVPGTQQHKQVTHRDKDPERIY